MESRAIVDPGEVAQPGRSVGDRVDGLALDEDRWTTACALGWAQRKLRAVCSSRAKNRPMSDAVAQLNTALRGRYRIERELGVGGMATVYLADDLRHGRKVALKVLKPDLAALVGAERFLAEIKTTANLQHPHILPLFDSGHAEGFLFYAMPYVQEESLRERLDRDRQLPVDEAIGIATKVANALEYAHSCGVVHRDIKPGNILLSRGEPLVADFGIALAVEAMEGERLTSTGMSIGTLAYMSPEQGLEVRDVDARSDIYSLGCVLYEMLVGDPPFTGSNAMAVLVRKSTEEVPGIRSVRGTVPEGLEAVVLKALQKVPADRHASAGEFAAALRAAIRDPTTPVPGTSAGRRPTGSGRRTLGKGALAAAAMAAVIVAVAWFYGMAGTGSVLDANRIMVFPLRVSEGYGGPASIGEDVATLIISALDGAGALRWIDGLAQLDPEARDLFRVPGSEEAGRMARTAGAAHFVTGSITPTGSDLLSIALTLYETASGEVVRTSAADPTPASEAWRAGLGAANQLLSQLIEGAPDVGREWRDREPAAVASFLRGEAAFRRVRLEEALGHYREAIVRDSSFVLAAIRGAQAAAWGHRDGEAAAMVERAMTLPLPPRYADFARGYAAYLRGDAEEAETALRRTVSANPEMAEAWMQIGETYTHLLPRAGTPDSLALSAFEEARRLDPTASNILLHMIEIMLRRGETGQAEPLIAQFQAANPDSVLAAKIAIMDRCSRDGPDGVDWNGLARATPFPLLSASKSFSAAAAQPACAMAGYRALLAADTSATDIAADGRRWASLIGLQSLLITMGRPGEAENEVGSFVGRWGYGTTLLVFDGIVADPLVPRALAEAQAIRDSHGPYEDWTSQYRLWVVGALAARHADVADATVIADELTRRSAGEGGDEAGLMARSLQAHIALAKGDSADALRRLEELVPPLLPGDVLSWDEFAPLGLERLALARLLVARGRYLEAIRVADAFDSPAPHIHVLFVEPSLRLRVDAATRIPHQVLVNRYSARLEALEN